jgi:hypothetical protein
MPASYQDPDTDLQIPVRNLRDDENTINSDSTPPTTTAYLSTTNTTSRQTKSHHYIDIPPDRAPEISSSSSSVRCSSHSFLWSTHTARNRSSIRLAKRRFLSPHIKKRRKGRGRPEMWYLTYLDLPYSLACLIFCTTCSSHKGESSEHAEVHFD